MTTDKIKQGIYSYGVYPALILLRELQDLEKYEDCAILKSAIDEILQGREYGLTTKVDDKSLKSNYKKIVNSMNNVWLMKNNMPYYIDEFKKKVLI